MRRVLLLIVLVLAANCDSSTAPSSSDPPVGTPVRLLMLTATAGFRHDSIATARQTLSAIGADSGEFTVAPTESLDDISPARLASVDVVMFALTTGELPFSDAQRAALLQFVNGGGGFVGVHSASDTLYEWPEYGQLVGAYFQEHPWTQEATVRVEAESHPAGRSLGASFRLRDEFYTFRDNPRSRVQVVLSLDPASVGAQGDFPLAWGHDVGQGRAFYTALGHFDATWADPRFQSHLRGAIGWAARRQ